MTNATFKPWLPEHLITITVTYHPDPAVLDRQLAALPRQAMKVIVDNASPKTELAALYAVLARHEHVSLLENQTNLGLAAALDQGIRHAARRWPHCTHVFLLDQDSEPQPGCIERLAAAFQNLEQQGNRPGAVGPQLHDPGALLSHGFHQMTRWHWRRVYPLPDSKTPIPVANLNGSGTYMSLDLYLRLGGLDTALFIDHVDTEWSFRLLSAGYSLWGIPDAALTHRMGERGLRFWMLRWRVWPWRSPLRHRYLFRNTVWLMRRAYVPTVWKFWAAIKLLLTTTVYAAADPRRREQLRAMRQGFIEGLRQN